MVYGEWRCRREWRPGDAIRIDCGYHAGYFQLQHHRAKVCVCFSNAQMSKESPQTKWLMALQMYRLQRAQLPHGMQRR